VQGQVAQARVLGGPDPVLAPARRRCRSSRSASCPPLVLVAKQVNRCPSMSVNRSCAPGCGRVDAAVSCSELLGCHYLYPSPGMIRAIASSIKAWRFDGCLALIAWVAVVLASAGGERASAGGSARVDVLMDHLDQRVGRGSRASVRGSGEVGVEGWRVTSNRDQRDLRDLLGE
jgi:hypothetical protein